MNDLLTPARAETIMARFGYPTMTELQRAAFAACKFHGGAREFIIGETSSGKTLIPLAAFQADRESGNTCKMLYLLPYRALASQKYEEMHRLFPDLDIRMSTSEYCKDDTAIATGDCDIALVVYEKAFMLLVQGSWFLSRYSHIVFDEIGLVESKERGFKTDYLLNSACSRRALNVYVLATPYYDWSPYIGKYHFAKKFEGRRPVKVESKGIKLWERFPAAPVAAGRRPQTLEEQRKAEIEQRKKENSVRIKCISKLCENHLTQGHKVLVFANSKKFVRELSQNLNQSLFKGEWRQDFDIAEGRRRIFEGLDITDKDLTSVFGKKSDINAYYNGISFHNASLPEKLREKIEDDFLNVNGPLKIVCATETLAFGLNSGIDVVIIAGLDKWDEGKKRQLTVNEYKNYIGRAGRYGVRESGFAYTLCSSQSPDYDHWCKIDRPDKLEPIPNSFSAARLDAANILLYLHLFDGEKGLSLRGYHEKLLAFPFPQKNEASLLAAADAALKELEMRHLITSLEYNELSGEKERSITAAGRKILGFIFDMETYDRLARFSRLSGAFVPLFDFLYKLFLCPVIAVDSDQDYKLQWPVKPEQLNGLKSFLADLRFKNEISPRLYRTFLQLLTRISSAGPLPPTNKKDRDLYLTLLYMTALYDWMHAVDLSKIYQSTGIDYSSLQAKSIKIKYMIDALLQAFCLNIPNDKKERLELLAVSFYYGIRLDILLEMKNLGIFETSAEIEPIDGRQLRVVSQVLKEWSPRGVPSQQAIDHELKPYRHFKVQYYGYLKSKCRTGKGGT